MPKGRAKAIGSPDGNPSGFIADAIQRGLSARGAVAEFRGAGGSIGNEVFRKLYGQVRDALAAVPDIAGLPTTARPPADAFMPTPWGQDGKYLYQFDVYTRPTGTTEVGQVPFSFTTDRRMSIDEAMSTVLDVYGGNEDAYDEEVLGANLSGLFQMGQVA